LHNHPYEITEKTPQKLFEGNMTMSVVITLWVSRTKCQTITLNRSDELP
jgi:hypothetical protein